MYLERLLTIVETVSVASADAGLSVAEIAEATKFPKASIYRQVHDLVEAGLLEPGDRGRYAIGLRTKRLAGREPFDQTVLRMATPLLKKAVQQHGATFFISHLTGDTVEIIHAEVPDTGVSFLHPGIGARPLHACSCAKVIAAFSNSDALLNAMKRRLRSYTTHTKTELGDLEREFQIIREHGFAECVEELENGVCSVAAPVVTDRNQIAYSLGATATTRVFSESMRERMGQVSSELCRELASMMDGAPGDASSVKAGQV